MDNIADDISHAYQDGYSDGYEKGKADAEFYLLHCGDTDEPPTNAERIRSMTDEELAKFFLDCVACDDCPVDKSKCKREWSKCTDAALAWLKSPAGVDE